MLCPLCNHDHLKTQKIDHSRLNTLYLKQYNITTDHLINETLFYSECLSCNLLFFHTKDGKIPVGDNNFYNQLNKIPWYYCDEKYEFSYSKNFIKPNSKVLEVGCGKGAFAKYIPTTQYTGLELSTDAKTMAETNGVYIENTTIQDYANLHQEEFDVVCSFQVLEHVSNPSSFISSQLKALRGGGILIVAIPSEDSFLKHVTNGILNMPPHHVSRFSDQCLKNISKIFNIKLLEIHHEPLQQDHFAFYKSVMFSRHFFHSKLLTSNPMIKITNTLGRLFNSVPSNTIGHTVIAIYQKE